MEHSNIQIFSIIRLKYLFIVIVLFLSSTSFAGNKNDMEGFNKSWALGVNVSTYGAGVGLSRSLSQNALVKLSYNFLTYTHPLSKLDEELEGNAKFMNGGAALVLDYYVWRKLYLSGGVVYNRLEANIDGQMAESVFIGDIEMYPEELGTVHLDLMPEYKIAPYIGMGIGQIVPTYSNLSFSMEIGAIYLGKPQVNLETTGMLAPTASKEQEELIQDNIAALDFLPTITFRLAYKIGGR